MDLSNGGGLQELQQFQHYLSDYKIIVYDGLNCDRLIFSGNSVSAKKLYLLYDSETGHYVITNIKAAMAKRYICNACDILYDFTHKCDKACSLCTATPPCTKDQRTVGHATEHFLVMFPKSCKSEGEKQVSVRVETHMSKLQFPYHIR